MAGASVEAVYTISLLEMLEEVDGRRMTVITVEGCHECSGDPFQFMGWPLDKHAMAIVILHHFQGNDQYPHQYNQAIKICICKINNPIQWCKYGVLKVKLVSIVFELNANHFHFYPYAIHEPKKFARGLTLMQVSGGPGPNDGDWWMLCVISHHCYTNYTMELLF